MADHNETDVTFVKRSIPHHQQGLEMAKTALDRAARPEVKQFAQHVVDSQSPEMDTLTEMLRSWGEDPSGEMSEQMPGVMSDEDMQHLRAASGEEFDRLFLEHMIAHHRGAIEMAEHALSHGESSQVKDFASTTVEEQGADIEQMRALLDG